MISTTSAANCSPIANESQAERPSTYSPSFISSTSTQLPNFCSKRGSTSITSLTQQQGRTAEISAEEGSPLFPILGRYPIHHFEASPRSDLHRSLQEKRRSLIFIKIQPLYGRRHLRPFQQREDMGGVVESRHRPLHRVNARLHQRTLPHRL